MQDLPGVINAGPNNELELSFLHKFHFVLPRDYPQNLGKIKIVNETPLMHPRMSAAGSYACYMVNGEVDRILVDLIYNVLMRPETVQPPSQFPDADWGLNVKTMQWYIRYGPQKLYGYLKQEWSKKQKHRDTQAGAAPKKVRFIGD